MSAMHVTAIVAAGGRSVRVGGARPKQLLSIDGRTLLGVVSFHDVAKAVYDEQSFENRMLKSYIKSGVEE